MVLFLLISVTHWSTTMIEKDRVHWLTFLAIVTCIHNFLPSLLLIFLISFFCYTCSKTINFYFHVVYPYCIPLYKEKGVKVIMKITGWRNVPSIISKVYGRIVINLVKRISKLLVSEEQGGCRKTKFLHLDKQ